MQASFLPKAPWALATAVLLLPAHAQEPILNEFQAANGGTLEDENGDHSDWIELFNPGPADFDLGGWSLTDDPGELTRWTFPNPTWIPAGEVRIVFASGKDRITQPLHTNFKLKASGEYLALVRPNGTVAHDYAPEYPPQVTDVSFGIPQPLGPPSYFAQPTPRGPNGPGGPLVLDVEHAPALPTASQDVIVTASVPGPLGAGGAVDLTWRVGFGPEQQATMSDDGVWPDATQGDAVFTGLVPAAPEASLLRWKVTASDGSGATTVPFFPDPEGSPEYFGTMVQDPSVATLLPVWWFWTEHPDQAQRPEGARAAVFYDGVLYDNVFVRRRGNTSIQFPKTSLKFDFNAEARLDVGEGPKADEANLNTTWIDKAYVRVPLAYELYRVSGTVAPESYAVRIQMNGSFFSVADYVEEPGDADYLERRGLDPNGALYKMFSPGNKWHGQFADKKTRLHEGRADLQDLVESLQSGTNEEVNVFDRLDVPACINHLAVTCLVHGNDQIGKNYYLYRDSEGDGEWRILPWDPDQTFGNRWKGGDTLTADLDPLSHPFFGNEDHPKLNGKWNRIIDELYEVPRVREMYLRRLRTLMDAYLQEGSTPLAQRYLETRIAVEAARLLPDVALDVQAWGHPTWGRPHDMLTALRNLRTGYLEPRREHLYVTHAGLIPGPHPSPTLVIDFIEGDPVSGDPAEEYVRLHNPTASAVDLSGWWLEGAVDFVFEPGTVLEAGGVLHVTPDPSAFRGRAVPPTGSTGLFVVGASEGEIAPGEWVRLFDEAGALVDELQY